MLNNRHFPLTTLFNFFLSRLCLPPQLLSSSRAWPAVIRISNRRAVSDPVLERQVLRLARPGHRQRRLLLACAETLHCDGVCRDFLRASALHFITVSPMINVACVSNARKPRGTSYPASSRGSGPVSLVSVAAHITRQLRPIRLTVLSTTRLNPVQTIQDLTPFDPAHAVKSRATYST
ncbi:hypothetical protein CEP54_003347 [Fusarium duplospermum]|uniref:Uncharacterized protein n=1 Tax=Fusarium duplospermum TaxID=1325734 RepID=A0A428QPK2_9HYPO|nr:hypothetical protein CEP54_003347 [Fusarium duplospermum]